MLSFQEFSQNIDEQQARLYELGELTDDSIEIQEQLPNGIISDRYAEEYAKYIKQFGIRDCFVGVEDSEDSLHILEIVDNQVQYQAESPYRGMSVQLIHEEGE